MIWMCYIVICPTCVKVLAWKPYSSPKNRPSFEKKCTLNPKNNLGMDACTVNQQHTVVQHKMEYKQKKGSFSVDDPRQTEHFGPKSTPPTAL